MGEDELRIGFKELEPALNAWGQFVTDHVTSEISRRINDGRKLAGFLKTKPEPRVKDVNSLIFKAYYRNYQWQDPLTEITDKVGTRFVVLLLKDIDFVSKIVEECPDWTWEQSRDFEREKLESPTIFAYQSNHYIVRANKCLPKNGIIIPEHLPCEIQIRTLMQHAFSEMSHDTVYKPQIKASPPLFRKMARCVALIEMTDEEFREAEVEINGLETNFEQRLTDFEAIYLETVNIEAQRDMRACVLIFEKLNVALETATPDNVRHFAAHRPQLGATIRKHIAREYLYSQPLIIPILYAINQNPDAVRNNWPFLPFRLEPMLVDMGIGTLS